MSENIVRLSEYQYGKVYKRLKKAAHWINTHRRWIKAQKPIDWFDYPDYWGMPKSISYKLSSDEVDFIQSETHEWYERYIAGL